MIKLFGYQVNLLQFFTAFLFGVRTEGEPINLEYGVEQPKHTVKPQSQPDQFSWMRELRVSSLHGVHQRVFY
jgi:hypothetical protein